MSKQPWDKLYSCSRWRALRKRHLAKHPLCAMCEPRPERAKVVDHIKPHKGNMALFWDAANLQSLCKRCHDSDKARIENGNQPRPKPAW